MKGVILDRDSLGRDIDLSPVTALLESWDIHGTTAASQVPERIAGASVVLSNKIPLDRESLRMSPDLGLISVMATGTNNVDLAAAQELGVTVCNAVAYATPSVVQHTIALILSLATNLPRYVTDVRRGAWQASPVFCRLDHPIVELSGRTLGIVGPGELGSGVARVAEALGMNILRTGRQEGPDRVPQRTLLQESDIVSLHCPLTRDNEGMINAETLALMKPTAFLVNTARGALINDVDLIDALRHHVIAGAAVDVLSAEPPGADDRLINADIPNLIITPHNAWGAEESRQRLVSQMAQNINAYLDGRPVRIVSP